MTRNQVRWYGDKFKRDIRIEARKRNSACAIAVHNHAKKLISIEGAAKMKPGRNAKGKFTKGKLIYGANPSLPGNPPHKQTGRLLGSIAWELISDVVARVGTNVRYGRWLELGTRMMAARPWLRRALAEKVPFIRTVWARPWKWRGAA